MIAHGRAATQMPAFADRLGADEVQSLVEHVYAAPAVAPEWTDAQIAASRIEHVPAQALPAKPAHEADPLNLFVVVEAGDHHVSILDGDRLEPIARFASRFAQRPAELRSYPAAQPQK